MNKTGLIVFPLFVMFIFCVMSIGASVSNGLDNSTTITGVNYSVLPNGTIIFNDDEEYHYLIFHEEGYAHEKGDILYNITWEDIYTIENLYGKITFKNSSVLIGYQPAWYGTEYFYWEIHDWWDEYKTEMNYYQYCANLTSNQTYGTWTNPFQTEVNLIITPQQGIMLSFIGIIATISVIGIKVFGTGISYGLEIIKGVIFFSIWGILSVIAQPMLSEIMFFGSLIYLGLSIMYLLGFVMILGGSNE